MMTAKVEIPEIEFPGLLPDRPVKVRDYSGFPWWHALLVTPGREARSAGLLERVKVFVYLPRYEKQVRCGRAGKHRAVMRAVVPGLLFVPREMLDIAQRDRIFELCGVHGLLEKNETPTRIRKVDIEDIRRIEAELNFQRWVSTEWQPQPGERVRFKAGVFSLSSEPVTGVVIGLEDDGRISLRDVPLFGQPNDITVSLADVEPDVADDAGT